jgi:hypothetical protein
MGGLWRPAPISKGRHGTPLGSAGGGVWGPHSPPETSRSLRSLVRGFRPVLSKPLNRKFYNAMVGMRLMRLSARRKRPTTDGNQARCLGGLCG